jgi:hypothetical protein
MRFYDPHTPPAPPVPADPMEAARIAHTRLRRRMLDGSHRPDVEKRRQELLGSVRSAAHGPVDLSANPFRVINAERAVLYATPPTVRHDQGDFPELTGDGGLLDQGGLWSLMQRFQAWTLGCREYLIRVHVDSTGVPRFRPVPPDMIQAIPSEDQPDQPIQIREWRLRDHPETGAPVWTMDVLSIQDPDDPQYKVLEIPVNSGDVSNDWTDHFLGGDFSGDAYPYRRADGSPFLPYVLYHAENLGDRLFSCYDETELVEGSLTGAVLLSMWSHTFRDASWPQRYAVNCQPAGISQSDTDNARRSEVIADPATVLMLEPIEEGMQPSIGQWKAGASVDTMLSAIDAFLVRLSQDAGVPPSDLQRMGGTARSGYAISLTNQGKRQQQARYRLQFKRADQVLIGLVASMLNRATGSNYPEDGYSVVHRTIALSPTEMKEKRQHLLEIARAGLISKTRAYMELNPGISQEQARRDLAIIAADRLLTT